jgi:hypothetical protein
MLKSVLLLLDPVGIDLDIIINPSLILNDTYQDMDKMQKVFQYWTGRYRTISQSDFLPSENYQEE